MTEPRCETSISPFSRQLILWTSRSDTRNPATTRLGRGLLLVIFSVAMLMATWAAWPNLIIDCGREMYVPAAMEHGKALYRDLWYPYGPLAPVVNAALFHLFGISLNTFYFSGFIVFTGSALVLHGIALRFIPPIAALLCGIAFLVPGFQSWLFNSIAPYSCAATFGALFCLLTLLFLLRYLENAAAPNLSLAGMFAALAVVTKLEMAIPCVVGLTAAIFLKRDEQGCWRRLKRDVPALLPGLAIVCGIYGWLIHAYGLDFLIHANWMSFPGSYFMRRFGADWISQSGLRFIPGEVARLTFHASIGLMFWLAFALLLRKRYWLVAVACTALFLLAGPLARLLLPDPADLPVIDAPTVSTLSRRLVEELAFPQGMFLVVAGFACFLLFRAVRARETQPALMVTAAMALAFALRAMMEIHPWMYSLYSSSLLYLVFLCVLWRMIDRVTAKNEPRPRAVGIAVWFVVYGLVFARFISVLFQGLPWPLIHTPVGDVRATQDSVILVNQFLPELQAAKAKGERVLLLPELTGLYFIADVPSASRYELLTPGVLEPGKYTDIFLHDLELSPPDLILLSNRRTSEYGVDYFGLDYDRDVLDWIEHHYRVTGEIGHFERRGNAPLSALIYRRRVETPATLH